MKNFSLKALAAFIFAAGLVVAGVAAPASAAPMTSPSATATGAIGTSGTNAYPITVTATSASPAGTFSNTNSDFDVFLPTGWSFVNTFGGPTCNSTVSYTGLSSIIGCSTSNQIGQTGPHVEINYGSNNQPLGIPAGTTMSVTFAAGTLNVAAARVFTINTQVTGTVVDTITATLSGGVSNSTVTFDANGGTGTTAAQTASTATALTANGFTRSGYTFAGWNTAANGSGTAYANGASYAFSSSTTLYAQWTASLANTGVNAASGISLLAAGLSLALIGAEMFIIARRKAVKAQK